jgi:hypothetical protein
VLYASEPNLNQVLIIDPTHHNILKTLPVAAAGGMDLSPDGSEIVVGSDLVAALTFINTASQSITSVAPFSPAESGANYFGPTMTGGISTPVFLSGGDVLFDSGSLFRWSAATNKIAKCNGQTHNGGTLLSRTPDGSKVLVTTSQNEMDVYDAATDSMTSQSTTFAAFAGADPANPRFAAFDSNGFEILDVNLHQLATLPFSNVGASRPYGLKFSLDGTQLFVAQSGMFGGLYAYRTVDAVHYTMGAQAPLMSFDGDDEVTNDVDSEVPLAIDENNLIYGQGNRGIAIDDPLNYYSSPSPSQGRGFEFFKPDHGPVGVASQTAPYNPYQPTPGVYFNGPNLNQIAASGVTSGQGGFLTLTTPAIATAGPTSVEMVEPDNSFSFYPAAFTFGVQASAVEPAAGPPGGGISADIIAYGVGGGVSSATVTVGGIPAAVSSVTRVGGLLPNPLPLYDVQFIVPPGTAGTTVDVTLSVSGNSSTLSGAFTYEPEISNYSYPATALPNSILYDPHRQRVYILASTQIYVFSMTSRSFLPPIVPPTLHGLYSLTGFDLSVDGSTLVIANLSDQSLAIVNPDAPSSAKTVSFALGTYYPYGPYSIAATSKGTFFVGVGDTQITGAGGSIYELNPTTGVVQQRTNLGSAPLEVAGFRLMRSADATSVLLASPDITGGPIVLWTATTDTFASLTIGSGFVDDGAISPDGTTIAVPADYPGYGYFQFVLDSSFDTLNSVIAPEGLEGGFLYGQFLNQSGALLYIPVINGIDIYDVHNGTLRKRIGVKEPGNSNIYQASTMDSTGAYLFLMTLDGLDVIQDVPPLSVRSVSPLPNTVSAGTVITLRGSDFRPGATITIGGQTVPAIVTDNQTLTFVLPAPVSTLDFTVNDPSGSTYSY